MQKETIIQGMLMCLSYLGHLCLDLLAQHDRGVAAAPWHPPHPPTPQGVDCAGGAVNFSCFSNYI